MRHVLLVLRILIVAGALASIVEPRAPYHLTRLALIDFRGGTAQVIGPEPTAVVRLALTAVSLALL